jgi:hypothetical protein
VPDCRMEEEERRDGAVTQEGKGRGERRVKEKRERTVTTELLGRLLTLLPCASFPCPFRHTARDEVNLRVFAEVGYGDLVARLTREEDE